MRKSTKRTMQLRRETLRTIQAGQGFNHDPHGAFNSPRPRKPAKPAMVRHTLMVDPSG